MHLQRLLLSHPHSAAETTHTPTGQNRPKSKPAPPPTPLAHTLTAPTATAPPCCGARWPLPLVSPSTLTCRSHSPTTPAGSLAAVAPHSPAPTALFADLKVFVYHSVYRRPVAAVPPGAARLRSPQPACLPA